MTSRDMAYTSGYASVRATEPTPTASLNKRLPMRKMLKAATKRNRKFVAATLATEKPKTAVKGTLQM